MGLRTIGGTLPARIPVSSVSSMSRQRSPSSGMNVSRIHLLLARCSSGVRTSLQQSIGPPGTPSNTMISQGPVVVSAGKTKYSPTPGTRLNDTAGLTYAKYMVPRKPFAAVSFNLMSGVGEYFYFSSLTTTETCEIMVLEGVPGGRMDCGSDVHPPEEHLAKSKWILDTFIPLEGERCRDIELTDDKGILAGRFPPIVRKPICKLPSGDLALGMGDVVVANDPITGQGANTVSKAASIYLQRILERGDKPFDAQWMHQTFDPFWDSAQWAVKWTNSLFY